MLVLWSKQSVTSHWVKEEANFVLGKGVLCPALIEPDVQIPFGYTTIQSAKLWDWTGTLDHPGFASLRAAIATLAPPPAPRSRPRPEATPQADMAALPPAANDPGPPVPAGTDPARLPSLGEPFNKLASRAPLAPQGAPPWSARPQGQTGGYVDLSRIHRLEWPVLAVFAAGLAILPAEVVLRYGFSSRLIWGFEATTTLFGLAMAGGAAMAAGRGMDFISPVARRLAGGPIATLARWLDLWIGPGTAVFLAWTLYLRADSELFYGETFMFSGLQKAYATNALATVFAALALVLARRALPGGRRRAT